MTEDYNASVQDALARICVSGPTSQNVALAIQLHNLRRQIRLTVVANWEAHDNLVPYLTNVWGKLRELSDTNAHYRKAPQSQLPPCCTQNYPHGDRESAVGSIKLDIFREIYQYTRAKNEKRWQKWSPGLFNLFDRIIEVRGPDLSDLPSPLVGAVAGLDIAHTLLAKQTPTDQEWGEAADSLEEANDSVNILLQDNSACETIVHDAQDPTCTTPFPLRHAFKKLTDQYRDIQTLFAFANSTRRLVALQCDITIHVVTKPDNLILEVFTSLVQSSSIEIAMAAWWENFIRDVQWDTVEVEGRCVDSGRVRTEQTAHCERVLIEYLRNMNPGSKGARNLQHNRNGARRVTGGDKGRDDKSRFCSGNTIDVPSSRICTRTLVRSGGGSGVRARGGTRSTLDSRMGGETSDIEWISIPPFRQIGVSSRSCSACKRWIEKQNVSGSPKFDTTGISGDYGLFEWH